MWVLDAWKDAEKIGYPVVWENIKDADNVIDYNINEEITKDASWVINANNSTTTGMATVMPWVNAPKLIASTSITWIPEPLWYIYAYITFRGNSVAVNTYTDILAVWISWQVWTPNFTINSLSGLVVPVAGVYQLDIERPFCWYDWYWDISFRSNKQWEIKHYTGSYNETKSETIKVQLSKWEVLSWYWYMRGSTTWTRQPNMYIWATRLW
jgi:hypothetical protein